MNQINLQMTVVDVFEGAGSSKKKTGIAWSINAELVGLN
jgi:hypothetical protein